MKIFYPVQLFADFITHSIFHFSPENYFGKALNFFIFDVIQIGILMLVISFLMAVINYYLPVEKIKKILTKRRWFGLDHFFAAVLGTITPFCSCSSIPLFIGFISVGIPLGVTLSFLISSPLVNEASLFLFPALFGWKLTLVYNILGILIAILSGAIIGKMGLEKYLQYQPKKITSPIYKDARQLEVKATFTQLLPQWWQSAWSLTKSTLIYIIAGVGIGALIHGFVPQTLVSQLLADNNWWSVPLATILGIPLYANSVSVLPIAQVLVNKGANVGTVLAFMTATVTLSIPQMLLLKKVMKWPLLTTYYVVVTLGMILMGYLINFIF